jgi:cell division septation protein DedD
LPRLDDAKVAAAAKPEPPSKEPAAPQPKEPAKLAAKTDAKADAKAASNVALGASTASTNTSPSGLPTLPAPKKEGPAGRFTLQLSAFPERADAEEFMKRMQAQGYKPFMVQSEVPGKGVFYRIRVGDYPTREAAISAKNDFEKKQRMIAYVAKL